MQSSPLYHHSAGTAHSKASGTMSDSLIGKETCIVDMKNAQNSVDCKQMPTTRGFRLFDLSVFGIYDKGMYDVIRKGAITELGTRDSDEAVESMVKNEPVLHCPDDVSQNVSSEAGQSGARVPETAVPREAEGTQDLSILNIENCCSRFENNRNLCEEIAERGMMSELGTRGSVEAVKSMIKNEPVLHPDDVSQNIFSEVGQSGAHVCESTAPREAGGTQDLSLINVENCGSGIEDVKSLCENIAERGMMSELGASSCDEAVQSLVENEPLLRHAGDEPQNVFSVAEQHGACVHESTELVETGDTRVLSTINLEDHCCGIGDTGNLSEESMGAAGSGLSRENLYSSNVKASGDEPLKDNDVSAETPYDNIPSIEELSVDPAHIDVSFGDWKVQLLTRPVQGVFADQKRTVATSHNRESSLNDDDDEVLAFSTSTVDSKHSGSLLINKGLQGSSHMAGSNDEPKQSILGGEPGFSVKTTFMQKVLHRDDLQSTAQQRFSHNLDERNLASDKVPNIEYPKSLFQKGTEGSVDHTMSSAYGEDLCSIPCINSDAPHTDSAEVIDERLIEPQRRNSFYNHPSSMLNLSSGRVSVTPILQKVKDKETIYMKDDGLRKKGMSMGCSNDSYIGQKIHQGDSNLATFASQKVDHVSQLNVSEKHVSQRWKGKENSSQCINIVEDLGGYRERVNAGCDQEDQPLTEGKMDKQLTDGYTFRLGQQQRDPSSRFDSLSMNFQRHPDMGLSASSMRRSSIDMQDGFHIERSRSKSEIRGQTHINRSPEHFSSHLGSNHSCQSQGLFSYEYPYNPDSFILGPSSKAPSHGAPQKASGQDHSLPLYTCGHHFVSPSWSLCTQPHCFIQHPQILPCSMVHPCAHCAIQASTVACHPLMHSEISGLDTCGLAHSKSPSNYFESGVLSAQPGRMDRSSMRKSDPVSCQRKNYYPPLPGKGAAPYVLCEECNQTLQVPEYLPSTCASVSKLRCGVCEKTCKFSLVHNHLLYNPDDGPMPAQSSPDLYFSPKGALISPNGNETRFEHEHMLKPVYDAYNGSKLSIDALRRSSMDLGRGGQRGDSQRKVVVNMSVIPEAEVQAAEVLAGPIHSGTYWFVFD
ncbi:hypothetical protein KP509_01G024400 [Ceratopteris richardii]|uniref:Probable zinc-ribbon domain-containing protein n=2 Tax=Ceratopteris richardii TaxID=49495 RepID=A0A8T2VBD9_CERRI|nr:hypothetical protein KP509_01G024400 [Ceratopteris richardii]